MRYNPNTDLFVIDASNVAYNGAKVPKFQNLEIIRKYLHKNGTKFFFIADYILFFTLRKRDKEFLISRYHFWKDEGILIECPSGIKADEVILEFAWSLRDENPKIISNDQFKDYYERFDCKWLESNLISFRIINNQLFLFKLKENQREQLQYELIQIKNCT